MHSDELTRLEVLTAAEIDIEGRMPWSSNATFLVHLVVDDERRGMGIYKPTRGERPLWDFEPGLHRRETAAYLLSAAMGLHIVPPTVLRDGPLGEGSVQWFVDANHEQHYFTIFEQHPELHDRLRDLAAFDVVANNTDRKSGHVLIDSESRIWGIDNGLCFSEEFKLRTVVWEFAGEPIPERIRPTLEALATTVPDDVAALLNDAEVDAIRERAHLFLELGSFPVDHSRRSYPWPLV